MGQVIQIDEERIKDHFGGIVRGTVEDTLNALLDAEADRLCNAKRYERASAARHAGRHLRAQAAHPSGRGQLRMPKLRRQTFETAIIERYRRRESSVEEALIEMYLAGVSVRRVEDITEALWGTRVSPSTVAELNQKIYAQIEAWRNRPIAGAHPYVYPRRHRVEAELGRRGQERLAAGGDRRQGRGLPGDPRHLRGCEGGQGGWSGFLGHLKQRGLGGVELIVSDACLGLVESAAEYFPEARWQRCVVHFYRNVFSHVPARRCARSRPCSRRSTPRRTGRRPRPRPRAVVDKLRAASAWARPPSWSSSGVGETLSYYAFPEQHWRGSGPTTRSSASCARSAGEPGWSGPSPTASPPEPRRGAAAAHRRHPVVDPQVHEHGAAPRGEERSLRSRRRVSESAKEFGRYLER